MTVQVTAVQVEALNRNESQAKVISTLVEISNVSPNPPVRVNSSQVEVVGVQPPQMIKTHGAQIESLQVEPPGAVRAHGSQVEVLHPMPIQHTDVAVCGAYVEVLRSITEKKRRPHVVVVAN